MYIQTSLLNLLLVEGFPNTSIISFLFDTSITKFFCFFSRNETPWCLTTFLKEQLVTIKDIINRYNIFFMDKNFINIYNYLINYTRNEQLYSSLNRNDNFSDRLTLFLLHFAFFLKNFKNEENKEVLQKIYDFNFRQLELSIREIGYGDQSINKKMKVYINLFHSMVSEIHFWDDLNREKKIKKLSIFLEDFKNIDEFVDYFEVFREKLSKKNLNYLIKGVIKS